MRNARIPGLALGIVHHGRAVHLRGFGTADDSGRAFTPQTPFFIGSNSKSFTALAVMQLVEAGKVDLDAPVQRYIPRFRVADPEASALITVRHLLNQTSRLTEGAGRSATLAAGMQPPETAVRAVPGHWEGDLILGSNARSAVGTLVERTTRYVVLLHLPNRHTADEVAAAMKKAVAELPTELFRT